MSNYDKTAFSFSFVMKLYFAGLRSTKWMVTWCMPLQGIWQCINIMPIHVEPDPGSGIVVLTNSPDNRYRLI